MRNYLQFGTEDWAVAWGPINNYYLKRNLANYQ